MEFKPMQKLPGMFVEHKGKSPHELFSELTEKLESFYEDDGERNCFFRPAEFKEQGRIIHEVYNIDRVDFDSRKNYPLIKIAIDDLVSETSLDYGPCKNADFSVAAAEIIKSSCKVYFNYQLEDRLEAERLGIEDRDNFILHGKGL